MPREHTIQEYEQELRLLREQITLMGSRVEEMLSTSMHALMTHDRALARRMIEFDHQINRLEVDTDELCLRILALRQPVASDLRFITTALKLVTDLERIGDLGVNICERVTELGAGAPLPAYRSLEEMARASQEMVREALHAFVQHDADKAQGVIEKDRKVDAYYAQIFRELLDHMIAHPESIYADTRLQSVAKYLERIADHATNLAEMTVFLVKGKDIRHLGKLDERTRPRGVLFLCVQNSARSQMAEGWARRFFPPDVPAWSAGSLPAAAVNPHAIQVMGEAGVDISTQQPKRISDVPLEKVDTVVTLCSEEICVPLPGERQRETWALPDPAAIKGSSEEILAAFRETRDEIRARVEALTSSWEKR